MGFGLLLIAFGFQQYRLGDRATIPPRILKQRTVLWSCLFSLLLSIGTFTHIYYLPFYFQAAKGNSAEESGFRTIPYLASNIVASVVIGIGVTRVGVFKPFMIAGAAVFVIGSGLLYTLRVDSSAGEWIGYQLLCGFGAEAGVQIPLIAVQAALSEADMPLGIAIATFFNSLGGVLSTSIAQSIFYAGLRHGFRDYAPDLPVESVLSVGPNKLQQVAGGDLGLLRKAYMEALRITFLLPLAVTLTGTVCCLFVEWKIVKASSKK